MISRINMLGYQPVRRLHKSAQEKDELPPKET
jgi:hypothetical protein